MAVKASVTITISKYRDVDSITRYYKLQASTASKPAKPTTLTPSGWNDTEPTYTSGSTNTLYFVDRSVFSDGTFEYSEVSISSSYEAAKEAYNKAQAAQNTANTTQENLDNLEIGGRNYLPISYFEIGTMAGGVPNPSEKYRINNANNPIIVIPSTEYILNINELGDYIKGLRVGIHSCDKDGNFINDSGWIQLVGNTPYKFTTRSDTYKLKLVFSYSETSNNVTTGGSESITPFNNVSDWLHGIKLKLEIGNIATDWTPAPEDIQSELNTSITNLNTNINSRIDDTEDLVSDLSDVVDTKIDAATANDIAQGKVNDFLKSSAWLEISDLNGAIRALTNSDDGTYQILEQKDGKWTFQLGKLFTDVKSTIDDITKAKNQLNGSTESTLSKRIDQLDEDTKYIKMTTYEGQPAIILGMENSPFQVRITNTAMEFVESGNVIAYVNNGAFYNTVGIVREEIKIVNENKGFSWKTRPNGNLGLQWVEET